jgi:tocopherol O-methyltransferase
MSTEALLKFDAQAAYPSGDPGGRHAARQQGVSSYYQKKTASIVRKYGPGPRIHFHIGLYDRSRFDHALDAEALRRRLVHAQEALIERAAQEWNSRDCFSGNLLDVGCGLGGGAIYWAQQCNTNVTAITIAGDHVPLIAELATQAGVSDRVHPLRCDASRFRSEYRFDAAVAMESACYLPRGRWFHQLAGLIRKEGVVCIEDTFLGHASCRADFDRYWKTRIGPVREYVEAAHAAGFKLEKNVDVTEQTSNFWLQSIAWSQRVLDDGSTDGELTAGERRRLRRSIQWHRNFYCAWQMRGIEVRFLKFRFRGHGT